MLKDLHSIKKIRSSSLALKTSHPPGRLKSTKLIRVRVNVQHSSISGFRYFYINILSFTTIAYIYIL